MCGLFLVVCACSLCYPTNRLFLLCIVLLLSVRGAELLAGVNDLQSTLLERISAKFINPSNADFSTMSADIKMTKKSHGGAIEDGAVDLSEVTATMDERVFRCFSRTSVHMDAGMSEKQALNNQGEYENVGCMQGVRFLFGWGEPGHMKDFSFYDRQLNRNASEEAHKAARIGQVYQFDNCWIYCFNGPVRHRVPQADRTTKIYHRGSSVGGACLNFIMTMTCDVKEVEVRWIMKQIVNFMYNVEALLTKVLAQ